MARSKKNRLIAPLEIPEGSYTANILELCINRDSFDIDVILKYGGVDRLMVNTKYGFNRCSKERREKADLLLRLMDVEDAWRNWDRNELDRKRDAFMKKKVIVELRHVSKSGGGEKYDFDIIAVVTDSV